MGVARAWTSGRPRLPCLLCSPRMPDESDRMLHLPPPTSLVPHVAATVRLPARPHMVLHVRTEARACCCAFRFVPCYAPVHEGGDHPRLCPRMLLRPTLRYCATCPWTCMQVGTRSTFATPDLFLQHSDETYETHI